MSVEQLVAESSPALINTYDHSLLYPNGNPLYEELNQLLSMKNGFYAFESALHVFPVGSQRSIIDIESWNSETLWKYEYGNLAEDCFCFAEDVFGMQFCIHADTICLFDAETAHYEVFAESIELWANRILEEYEVWTGYPIAHKWQQQYGAMPVGKRLFPKKPFFAGGDFSIDNLYLADSVGGMRARGNIAQQVHDLPDGATIEFVITEYTSLDS